MLAFTSRAARATSQPVTRPGKRMSVMRAVMAAAERFNYHRLIGMGRKHDLKPSVLKRRLKHN